jgi:hypothetical protein
MSLNASELRPFKKKDLLSDPSEYGTEDADRGAIDEKRMAHRHRIQTYQRIRTVILRDAWLIDHEYYVKAPTK